MPTLRYRIGKDCSIHHRGRTHVFLKLAAYTGSKTSDRRKFFPILTNLTEFIWHGGD